MTILLEQLIESIGNSGARVEFYTRSDTKLPWFCLVTTAAGVEHLGAGSTPADAIANSVASILKKRGAA